MLARVRDGHYPTPPTVGSCNDAVEVRDRTDCGDPRCVSSVTRQAAAEADLRQLRAAAGGVNRRPSAFTNIAATGKIT